MLVLKRDFTPMYSQGSIRKTNYCIDSSRRHLNSGNEIFAKRVRKEKLGES